MNVADRFAGNGGSQTNPLSKHFEDCVRCLLAVTERQDADNELHTASYEILNSLILNSANDSLDMIAALSNLTTQGLEQTIPMQQQVVSTEDNTLVEGKQVSLISVILTIIQCLGAHIKPQADRIMQVLLQILSIRNIKSSVSEVVFTTIGAVASVFEEGFGRYMEPLKPFVVNAFSNSNDPGICSITIGLISDADCALNEKVSPFWDNFLKVLLSVLHNSPKQLVSVILQTFGDIARAMSPTFNNYLTGVGRELQQITSTVTTLNLPFEKDGIHYPYSHGYFGCLGWYHSFVQRLFRYRSSSTLH